jgi:hypothetical protein
LIFRLKFELELSRSDFLKETIQLCAKVSCGEKWSLIELFEKTSPQREIKIFCVEMAPSLLITFYRSFAFF